MENYDVIIIGAGFCGSTLAEQFASDGKKVLILEKRNHIGGNMYEDYENGERVHRYGPHIFHTSKEHVFDYLKQFGDWFFYEHRVLGKIDGKLVPIPFNFKSLELLFDSNDVNEIKEKLLSKYEYGSKVSILELIQDEDEKIKEFGEYVFEKVFVHYTAKQWQIPIEKVDKSVINRVPVLLGYDDRYFGDKFQFMPKKGFTEIFNNMLSSQNIKIETNCNALDKIELKDGKIYFENKEFNGKVIYTGLVDELLNYKFGELPYRSLNLIFETKQIPYYQPVSVVNYPNDEDFTRITEFKYLSNEFISDKTVILKEYPKKYIAKDLNSIPYYAINNEVNNALYNKYVEALKEYKNLYLCGRLAEYKYYNMDDAIDRALRLYKEIR